MALLPRQPRARRCCRPSGATSVISSAAESARATSSRWLPAPCTGWGAPMTPSSGSGIATTRSTLASQVRRDPQQSWSHLGEPDSGEQGPLECPLGCTGASQLTGPLPVLQSRAGVSRPILWMKIARLWHLKTLVFLGHCPLIFPCQGPLLSVVPFLVHRSGVGRPGKSDSASGLQAGRGEPSVVTVVCTWLWAAWGRS